VPNLGVGKGAALRTGIDSARGHVVVLMDADLPVSVEDLVAIVGAASRPNGTAIVVGTRRQQGATNGQPALRRAGGSGFLLLTRVMGYAVVSDPQCGLKALAGSEAIAAALDSRSSGFEWDIELLARARLRGVPVRELPVVWIHRPGSTVRPVRDALRTLWGLARLRPSLRAGRLAVAESDPATTRR
jgi:glycosyltransferase involved in cell wall biosynthesis